MKKIFSLTFMLLFIASNCFAMSFSQPEQIGKIIAANMGGFGFKGESQNNGVMNSDAGSIKRKIYNNGIASFGEGDDTLYFHYKMGDWQKNIKGYMNFGDNNISNTVPVNLMYAEIFKIKSDTGMVFYLIHDTYDIAEESWYTLIGKNKSGKWVKYFDTVTIGKNYFGSKDNNKMIWGLSFGEEQIKDDVIVIHYERNTQGKPLERKNADEIGEFRFKWNETAQWFGVEHIIY